ncbi:diversity-generating retroelement protein Avd [Candidatus Venteria ishoeyi]|uniref:bAvd-like domain-containing protein n=1 Tax=Candidatus Venteria ishoeyi TaxID=1899563 RepID=A0A1H6FG84_9GAMM|nr:diversity-generating retroelement protein Avd [Candidatus Venteria ishoeyi]SEH09080.1 Uncharacterised protein [Candidatus Venteria ishoeyi]
MALQDFKVYIKTYDFMNWLFPVTQSFPKSQRFVAAQRIENTVLNILEAIIEGNAAEHKLPYVRRALTQLELLYVLLRFAKTQRWLDLKKYQTASEQLSHIERLLGGWLRACQKREKHVG